MFTKGQYLKKKDGNRISKANKYPVFKVNDCRVNPEVDGGLIVNSVMKILPEWFEVITEEEYNAIRNDPKYSQPSTPKVKEVSALFILPGQAFRKKNWEFFGEQPCVKAATATIKGLRPGEIKINGNVYIQNHLVVLTDEEYITLREEWASLKISNVLDGKLETVHYREDTGEEKKGRTVKEALKYTFTYNKKNPGKDMNAYMCPYCMQVHCGKIPKPDISNR